MKPFLYLIVMMLLKSSVVVAQSNEIETKQIIVRALKKFQLPAMSIRVMSSEKMHAQVICGVRRIGTDNAVKEEDYFHIGSCSKSVLAVIAGKLCQEGKITWRAEFFDVFPELKSGSHPAYSRITLEDLFVCEAGIKPFTTSEELFPIVASDVSDKRYEFAKWLLTQPPSSTQEKSGKFGHVYSNAGYTLAALMLERASGLSWENLVIGLMNEFDLSVSFGFPVQISVQQPWGHGYFDYDSVTHTATARKELKAFGPADPYRLHELIAPAGDLSLRSADYARYTQLHLRGLKGADPYLDKEAWNHIHFSRKGFSIGVGNSVYYGKSITGFDGSAGTFYCRSIIIVEDDLAFTIMTNAGSPEAVNWVTRKIMKRYYRWWWKFWM